MRENSKVKIQKSKLQAVVGGRWSVAGSLLGSVLFLITVHCALTAVQAQTTAFTYQGSLKDGASPANGNYDFEFKLFDLVSGGPQQGSTVQRLNVAVTNGIFSVSLDFGAGTLPGADRFLEIGLRVNGNPGGFQQLLPRQMIASTPYSVKSLAADSATNATNATTATNATQLGGVAANQYVVTTDPRMTNARPPTAGSSNYIQNQNAAPQSSSNFNISGTGTGNIFNAATQYNINGNRILSAPGNGNLFAGLNAGEANTQGQNNAFFGSNAGLANTTGVGNAFFGSNAGSGNTIGNRNTAIGPFAGFGSGTNYIEQASAIGSYAVVEASNSLVLGAIIGEGFCGPPNTCQSVNVGIGTTTPQFRFHVKGTPNILAHFESSSTIGTWLDLTNTGGGRPWAIIASGSGNGEGAGNLMFYDGQAGATRMFINPSGVLTLNVLGAAGATQLCRNASNEVSTCSSSLRYKTNIGQFSQGLSFVNRLRPISFDWKDGGMKDVGFGAEDIAKIDPRFVTYNSSGEVEGVKYDRLSVAFVNAFKEQQAQIETMERVNAKQEKQNDELQKKVDALKAIVCSIKADAEVCNSKEK